MSFLGTWLVSTIATIAAIVIVPGIQAVGGSYLGPAMCALALAFVNAWIKPVIKVLSLPVTLVTFGLFSFVINAFMLEIASGISTGLFGSGIQIDSFGSALLGSIIISLATSAIYHILGNE